MTTETEMKIDYNNTAQIQRFIDYVEQTSGKETVLSAEVFEPAKGGGFQIVFNSELAALRIFHYYSKDITTRLNFVKNGEYAGFWAVSATPNN